MAKEACIIKGDRYGLSVTIPTGLEFSEVLTQLRERLMSAQQFFAGANIKFLVEEGQLEPDQREELKKTAEEFGLVIDNKKVDMRTNLIQEEPAMYTKAQEVPNETDEQTLLVRRTVRSGQRIEYDGNVVIQGDVNPGAEVICSGDILVLGALRGVAHAGCKGDVAASVFAFYLEPTQLRIANYISRSPDEQLPQPQGPEIARVSENIIQISAYN